jgi:hypothetical protein
MVEGTPGERRVEEVAPDQTDAGQALPPDPAAGRGKGGPGKVETDDEGVRAVSGQGDGLGANAAAGLEDPASGGEGRVAVEKVL